jgi:hypothetical protein
MSNLPPPPPGFELVGAAPPPPPGFELVTPPQGFMANAADFFKSIPRGVVSGLTSAPNPSMVPGVEQEAEAVAPARAQATQALQAPLPAPQGPAGQFGQAVGEGLGNPMSYLGPGSAGLKVGGAVLSSLGAEGGRQAAEGTAFEKPAQIGGAVLGGVTAAKTLGPAKPKAAIPTHQELFTEAKKDYKGARNTGLEVDPQGGATWATKIEQELLGPDHGFTGGPQGIAPKTFSVLGSLQNPPPGAVITASNLDALRKNLGRIAQETQPAQGGFAKPTPDAAAASIALKSLGDFVEGDLRNFVVGGDPQSYVRLVQKANANWGAGERTRDFDTRLTKAERATDRQVAGSLDSQIKIKSGQLLDNQSKTRGLAPEELQQLELINSGDWKSNPLRQMGRGGAGVIPLMSQLAAAPVVGTTLGAPGLALQALIASGLYGARKGSEAITKSRANKLAEMLAKRSPLYEERVKNLPPPDTSPGTAAIIRALLNSQ